MVKLCMEVILLIIGIEELIMLILKLLLDQNYLQEQANLAKNFKSPDPSKFNYEAYQKYINEKLPQYYSIYILMQKFLI